MPTLREARRRLIRDTLIINASIIASLVAARADLGETLKTETAPLDAQDRWWVYKCPSQGCAGFLAQPGVAENAGHLELAGGALTVGGEFFQFGSGERRRRGFSGVGGPEGAGGAGGLRQQAGVNEPLQGLVGRAVDHFQAHGSERVPLARAEVFLVQRAELLAVLRGIALDDEVKD